MCVCYEGSNGRCVWSILYTCIGVGEYSGHIHWENRHWCRRCAGYRAEFNTHLTVVWKILPRETSNLVLAWARGVRWRVQYFLQRLHFRECVSCQCMPYLAAGILQLRPDECPWMRKPSLRTLVNAYNIWNFNAVLARLPVTSSKEYAVSLYLYLRDSMESALIWWIVGWKKNTLSVQGVFALSRCWVNPLTIDETDASHNIYLTSSAQFGLALAGGQKGK